MNNDSERWKYIDWLTDKGIPADKYMISDHGQCLNTYTNRILYQGPRKNGIRTVSLSHRAVNNTTRRSQICVSVARCVAMKFVIIPDDIDKALLDKLHVKYKDGNHSNLHYTNLTWNVIQQGGVLLTTSQMKEMIKTISELDSQDVMYKEITNICFEKYHIKLSSAEISSILTGARRSPTLNVLKMNPSKIQRSKLKCGRIHTIVGQYDIDGKLIRTYESIRETSRINNFSRYMLLKAVKNSTELNGYIWKYLEKKSVK